ncbi:MAG: sigma-70 family RNA polymerase sigma factor [Pseudomonadota bacterium]
MALDDPEIRADARALKAYANGDKGVAEELAARHVPRVLALAYHMLGERSEAEDVAQEAMLRLWKIAPEWEDGRARISTWLYRVTANLCTDRLRRRGRQAPMEAAGDPADPARGALAGLLEQDRAAALRTALGGLPESQRLAVTLRHLEERGNREIAEIMISVEAVESLIARGKRGLRKALEDSVESLSYKDDPV